jgi:RNA polymerase sigma factor (sigma-70 family)
MVAGKKTKCEKTADPFPVEQVSSMSDETLMMNLSQGQMHCAAQLFERYHLRLFNFFLRLTGNRPLSEDLTQTVFERLIRYRGSYVEGRPFRSWIYQVARNVRIDHAVKNRHKMVDLKSSEVLAGTGEPVSRQLEAREEEQRLHQALNRLSDDQREILVLTRFQHLKYKEVAQLMNTTEGAVKVRVHRAIKELRDIYLKMEDV